MNSTPPTQNTEPTSTKAPAGTGLAPSDEPAKHPHYLPVTVLRPHPKNPRVTIRRDVVEQIAAELRRTRKFLPQYALTVRPVDGGYEVISGHQRLAAAKLAELKEVPCWIVEMTDEEAFFELMLANHQAEVSSLEIGIHCLDAIENRSAPSIAAYAERLHLERSNVSVYVKAAGVARSMGDRINPAEWLDKAQHLAAIGDAPDKNKPELASRCIKEKWSARKVRAEVKRLSERKAGALADATGGLPSVRRIAYGEDIEVAAPSVVILPALTVRLDPLRDEGGAIVGVRVCKPDDPTGRALPEPMGTVVSDRQAERVLDAQPPSVHRLVAIQRSVVEGMDWREIALPIRKRLRQFGGREVAGKVAAASHESAFHFVAGERGAELHSLLRNRRSVIDASLLVSGFRPVEGLDAAHPERAGSVVLVAYGEPRSLDRVQKVKHVAVGWYDRDEARVVGVYSYLPTFRLVVDHPVQCFGGGELGLLVGAWWAPA